MSKSKRGKRSGRVANRRNTSKLGKEQLPAPSATGGVPGTVDGAETPDTANERGSSTGPDGGGRVGDSLSPRTEEGMDTVVRSTQANEGGGPAEDRFGDWPFRVVKNPGDLEDFGTWLQVMGREVEKTPIGIAANSEELAFATKEQGWIISRWDWPDVTSRPLIRGVIGRALTSERTGPALVTRNTGDLVQSLNPWLGEGYDRTALLSNIKHDMRALEYASGRPIVSGLPMLKDALDCATVGPGMALEAPKFYYQVGLPLVRLNASILNLTEVESEGWRRWTLVYDWLLFKVLAHYTRDPTTTRWLQDEQNPLTKFCQTVNLETRKATAFLLWMICGEDEALVSRYYPDWATHMPEAPQLIKASRVDKTLPALRMGLLRLLQEFEGTRRAVTLYGRNSPWGLNPQELLHFVIMGSVNDILDVVVASIAKMGSTTHWLVSDTENKYNRWLRASIVGYIDGDSQEWQQQLEELGKLGNPLGMVSLDPRAVVE